MTPLQIHKYSVSGGIFCMDKKGLTEGWTSSLYKLLRKDYERNLKLDSGGLLVDFPLTCWEE
jgi:hypothetical protein